MDTVTIKLNGKAKQTFARFSGGTAEEALRHVRVFWSVPFNLGHNCIFWNSRIERAKPNWVLHQILIQNKLIWELGGYKSNLVGIYL